MLIACAALAFGLSACGAEEDPFAAVERPNLIVVMTDDQVADSFEPRAMPKTWELFAGDRGAVFADAIAAPPLCCPSRAGFLTGSYPHNHGVLGNVPGYASLRDKGNVLPVWLRRGGYRTAFIGKYLNGYEPLAGGRAAPGWDSWHAVAGYPAYFDYEIDDNGRTSRYGSRRRDYSTTQLTDRAIREVRRAGRDPLFMWLALNAPHVADSKAPPCEGEVPVPRSRRAYERFAHDPPPPDPAYDERDRSDKPRHVAERSAISAREREAIRLRWRCGQAALRAADAGIARLVAALERAGELERSVLVFVSDNGYFFGEHAIGSDKRLPYDASVQVPLAVRVGSEVWGPAPPGEIGEIVATVDLAPTLLDYAGAEPCAARQRRCRTLDGRSLRPLLEGSSYPSDRAILLELDEPLAYRYEALRTARYMYSRIYRDRAGELPVPGIELYDLERDPAELDNLWALDRARISGVARRLDRRLDRLASCRGSEEQRFERPRSPGDCE